MPYKPTGRPPGRPRTSTMRPVSIKLPEELLLDAQVEASLSQTTLSTLVRDGLARRLEETALARATRQVACVAIRAQVRQEAYAADQARRAAARVARVEQEGEAIRQAVAMILMTQAAIEAGAASTPTRGQAGVIAAIRRTLAPHDPNSVPVAAILAWCEANKVAWATPALVEQALVMIAQAQAAAGAPERSGPCREG